MPEGPVLTGEWYPRGSGTPFWFDCANSWRFCRSNYDEEGVARSNMLHQVAKSHGRLIWPTDVKFLTDFADFNGEERFSAG
jgi:hypothetical protein